MPRSKDQNARFATTHWSLVQAARGPSTSPARAALATLCEAYWYPLYAFVRRRGLNAEDARDLTQAFFAQVLEKQVLDAADPNRGRFRAFLLVACRNFLAREADHARAQKRGGGRAVLSLDFTAGEHQYLHEPAHETTAERLFERRWALTLLDRVLGMLAEEYARAGKSSLFERLQPTLVDDAKSTSHAAIAAGLGMTEGAVKVAAHRLRKRFRTLLRDEIGKTVATPEDVDDEIQLLFNALRPD